MTGALFPGQGSEREGMYDLIKPSYKKYIESLSSGIDTQFGIYAVSASLWDESGRSYSFSLMAGHSLGFYSALFASGSIDFETGIFLIDSAHKAITHVSGSGSYGMTAIIGIKWDIIESLCRKYKDLYIANINSATQVVVSGAMESIEAFEEMTLKEGALKILRLPVKYPLHTPILAEVPDIMRETVKGIELKPAGIPVMDHTSGETLTAPEHLMGTLTGQFSRRVVWRDVISRMSNSGIKTFVEIGPGDTLSKLTRWIERDAEVVSLDVRV